MCSSSEKIVIASNCVSCCSCNSAISTPSEWRQTSRSSSASGGASCTTIPGRSTQSMPVGSRCCSLFSTGNAFTQNRHRKVVAFSRFSQSHFIKVSEAEKSPGSGPHRHPCLTRRRPIPRPGRKTSDPEDTHQVHHPLNALLNLFTSCSLLPPRSEIIKVNWPSIIF